MEAASWIIQAAHSKVIDLWHGDCLLYGRKEETEMRTKLIVGLLLAGSSLFAAPRVAVGIGVGFAAPAPAYVAPAPLYPAPVPAAYYAAPPALVYAAPGPGYTWTAGYWYGFGPRRVWRPGYWVAPRGHYYYGHEHYRR